MGTRTLGRLPLNPDPQSALWKQALRQQLESNFGPTASQFRLGGDPERPELPSELEIWLWHPDAHSDLSTLATCGLAAQRMPDSKDPDSLGERAELHFAWLGKVSPELEVERVRWLAQLALVPWNGGEAFAWGQVLSLAADIPGFPGCNGVLLHPPFSDEGWAFAQGPEILQEHSTNQVDPTQQAPETVARIHNIVPLQNDERLLASQHGLKPLFERWQREDRNPFQPI